MPSQGPCCACQVVGAYAVQRHTQPHTAIHNHPQPTNHKKEKEQREKKKTHELLVVAAKKVLSITKSFISICAVMTDGWYTPEYTNAVPNSVPAATPVARVFVVDILSVCSVAIVLTVC